MASDSGDVQWRLDQIELEINELKKRLDAQARTLGTISTQIGEQVSTPPKTRESRRDTPVPPAREPSTQQMPEVPAAKLQPVATGAFEANLVGTWFARVGAVAILLGAGFAFKYAIDRGIIGPAARVAIGVAVGLAFVAWGEWAHRREWPRFGQAVGGGGVALVYLSLWAAFDLYDLISQTATFVLLIAVVAGGAALALRHDSQPLAVLATLGGFLIPFLIASGEPRPGPLYAYALVFDLAVLSIGYWKRWRLLDGVAFVGTWFVFAAGLSVSKTDFALVYASVFFVFFTASAVLPLLARREQSRAGDLTLLFINTAVYYGFGMGILQEGGYSDSSGIFTFSLAIAFLILGLGMRGRLDQDRRLMVVVFGLSITFLTVAVALQLDAPWTAIVWTIEAAILLGLGYETPMKDLRWAGAAVLAMSLFASFTVDEAGQNYAPERLLFSTEALTILLQIAVLYGTAYLVSHTSEVQHVAGVLSIVLANILSVAWLSLEARAYFDRLAVPNRQGLMFTITAIWSIYAVLLMAVGVSSRARLPRLMSVVMFGLVIIKMAAVDLWFLPTGYRVIAFMGLGAVLLAVSLLYHRFRDFIFSSERAEESLAAT